MEKINLATTKNAKTYYIDKYGDIHNELEQLNIDRTDKHYDIYISDVIELTIDLEDNPSERYAKHMREQRIMSNFSFNRTLESCDIFHTA